MIKIHSRILALSLLLTCMVSVDSAMAERTSRASVAKRNISAVCPASSIRQIGSSFFYKNNKPIRASSAKTAPVIGQNPVMTLAGQPGGPRIFGGAGVLFASNGTRITTMTPYSCYADHCSGRVVSSLTAGAARATAIRVSGKPSGYVKVGGACIFVPDLGRCFGAGVNMGRPLCDRTLTG